MNTTLKKAKKYNAKSNLLLLIKDVKDIPTALVDAKELDFIKQELKNKNELIALNHFPQWVFVLLQKEEKDDFKRLEKYRRNGTKLVELANKQKLKEVTMVDFVNQKEAILALAEGMALANYQFLKYMTKDIDDKKNNLSTIGLISDQISDKDVFELNVIIDGNIAARTFVNEPLVYLSAVKFSEEITELLSTTKAKVEVFHKKKIESLKMGGLLAVNKGSIDPPTFTIIEWKPQNAKNIKPYVFVGKGVVFDTGGVNIKTGNYMNDMKCDMAGAAAVAGALYTIAKNELPIYVIGLIPATDNRPSGNAYVPDDVITMFDGTTVEIKNTDAEGRLILADALAYAKKYDPELVIDLATLTGAAHRAIGIHGIVAMGKDSETEFKKLDESGYRVQERLAHFPFWDEYDKEIESPVADIKNLGGELAGAITAGKFLAYFTNYPYIHLDIAGPAFLDKKDHYKARGGTGVGVRLLYDFIKKKA